MEVSISKSALSAARTCDLRGYRSLVRGDRWTAQPPPAAGLLIGYRARHVALSQIHRLWQRGGTINPDALVSVWQDAWLRSGGDEPIDAGGLEWLVWYARENPFHLQAERRILWVEQRLWATYQGRAWQARPDLLVECLDGDIEALELSGARTPLLDRTAVNEMATIDQLVLSQHRALTSRPHRVLVAAIETGVTYDVTLTRQQAREVLANIVAYISNLESSIDNVIPNPSPEACIRCPYRADCEHAWPCVPTKDTTSSTMSDDWGLVAPVPVEVT